MVNSELFKAFEFVSHLLTLFSLSWYFMTNMQWYSYKIERVLLKHHKGWWHFFYFGLPFILYHFSDHFFWIFFYFGYLPILYSWHKNLDRKLVLTWRVKRFFIILISLAVFGNTLCLIGGKCETFSLILPLIVATVGSMLIEKIIFRSFYKKAESKLKQMHNLKIITITGSYGKTSVKNFLYQVLSKKYRVYATPKSVNTTAGIVRDINESLSLDTDIYIVEAGARERGDINEISQLVKHQYGIITKIGPQHIEYFGDILNIVKTKMEIKNSPYLKKLLLNIDLKGYKLELKRDTYSIQFFGNEIIESESTLDGTKFKIRIDDEVFPFSTPVLGSFQSENLNSVILLAKELGMSIDEIHQAIANLKPVPHRLEKITAGGKIIIDDGFNGNIDGMLEAFRLVSKHNGRKVLVTPGLVESSDELNEKVAFEIDELFDVVIITGSLNRDFFKDKLISKVSTKIFLENKSQLESVLQKQTRAGDVILFANDAPNFI